MTLIEHYELVMGAVIIVAVVLIFIAKLIRGEV